MKPTDWSGFAFGCWFPHPFLELTPAPEMQQRNYLAGAPVVCSSCYLEQCAQGSSPYAFGLAYVRGPAKQKKGCALHDSNNAWVPTRNPSVPVIFFKKKPNQKKKQLQHAESCENTWNRAGSPEHPDWYASAWWSLCTPVWERRFCLAPKGIACSLGVGACAILIFQPPPPPAVPQVVQQKFSSKTVTLKRDFNSLKKRNSTSFQACFNKSDATPCSDFFFFKRKIYLFEFASTNQ